MDIPAGDSSDRDDRPLLYDPRAGARPPADRRAGPVQRPVGLPGLWGRRLLPEAAGTEVCFIRRLLGRQRPGK